MRFEMNAGGNYWELMAELPVITFLACSLVFTFEPIRSKTFLRTLSRRSRNFLRAAAVLAIAGGIVRICMVNAENVPMLLLNLLGLLVGLPIGCGVVLLLRRCVPGFRNSKLLERWLFAFFALLFFALAALFAFTEGGNWQAVTLLAGLGSLELYVFAFSSIGKTPVLVAVERSM
jgi:hypothetical protein